MTQQTGTLERRGLAKGLRLLIDIMFFLTLLAAVSTGVLWPIAGIGDEAGFDLNIPVLVGESSILPVHRLEVDLEAIQGDLAGASNFRLVGTRGELRLQAPGKGHALVFWAVMMGVFSVVVLSLQLLRKILATAAEGRPFDPENVRRLNLLGSIILISAVAVTVIQHFLARWILKGVAFTSVALSPPLQLQKEWIICGLLVLLLAAIWKEAVRMAEEQSLTV
jgi:hypothetical protein